MHLVIASIVMHIAMVRLVAILFIGFLGGVVLGIIF